ncbi:hypothetical protein LCM10_03430 [Rossellomorea aquimaris]|uniref:hypothetical protein n=1 Tax=Rossellomorea aquimaris TaxID=189382 RepID=UPI001CD215FF|nr:hypothetical protein [Rossellomorea aquimaris]MCA1054028.1 hypothetical protein [Rossellomorea aquimaris]
MGCQNVAQESLSYETELTDDQVMELAKRNRDLDEAWKTHANEGYGITVTPEEVDDYIKEGPDTSDLPQHQAYADALGLSLEELNHDFDRDLYEKNVIWLKLQPVLEKKYDTANNNELVKRYEEEVGERLR